MTFSEIFIRRPVLSTVVSLLILLLGAQGLLNLQLRQYPEVAETVVTVTTAYPGASAELMQGFVTAPIARAVATTENVDYVTSSSRPSVSTVTIQMRLGADPNSALTEVISKVNQVRGQLPPNARDPVIQKGTGQQFALMYLAVLNPQMTGGQITEYLDRVIRPRMTTIDGVGQAQIIGAQNFAMRVWLDPVRLAARDVTAAEVLQAISASNFLSAPGSTQNEYVAYSITMQSTLQTPEAFGALPLRSKGAEVVRLRDVAEIEFGSQSSDTIVTFDGNSGTFLAVFPTPSANPLDTATGVRNALPGIQASMPEGMTISLVYDSTVAISSSIDEVFHTIGEAVVIVILVILIFLGSFRAVLVPIATIPLSLIGVCFFLYLMGYSINTLTLLAMVLAIGLVVDDAIIVVENIHRHIDAGLKPIDAAVKGMREISRAIVAMTVTLAAVFAPLAFTAGITGALFREFAFALAGSVVISGVVALTVSPMMAALLLKDGEPGRFQRVVDGFFIRLENWYERRLSSSLDYRPVTLLVVLCLIGTTGFLLTKTSSELAPSEDQGALFSIATGPRYATTDYTQLYLREFDDLTKDVPEVENRFSIIGFGGQPNTAFAAWILADWGDRKRSQAEIQRDIQGRISESTGVQAFVFSPPSLPGAGGGLPISYVLRSTGPADQVFEVADRIREAAMASGRFVVVQNSLSFDAPQVSITIDRERAAALGIPVSQIGETLSLLVGQAGVGRFDLDSNSYDIIPQVPQRYRANPDDLSKFFVRSASGAMVPLSSVVSVGTNASPAAVEQFNQLNSATLTALPKPGTTTAEGLQALREIAASLMPDGFYEDYSGQSRLEATQGNTILLAFVLAIIVIYLVLAAQFESFRDPFIIMMTVPLSIFGAIVPLNLGFGTLNIFTQVGLITLIGIITKHGILMVEFANQQREWHGHDRRAAIVEAARVRLRPVLMTTAALALAVIPLIIASGSGAAARHAMGIVIFFGLLVGTIFTLFVVPMFYTYVSHPDVKRELEPAVEPVVV
jgi:multidrug efflux pump